MPSKKKKYSARFPPTLRHFGVDVGSTAVKARIKKIMQTDEDVGKVAAAVPVLISRALERFIETLIVRTSETTQSKNAKTLTTTHIKQTIHAEKKFDFLKDLVAAVPDHQTEEDADNGGGQGDTKKQKIPRQKKQKEGGRKKRKTKNSSESSENEANGEEEEEKEETSSTDTDEEMNEHSQMYAKSPDNPVNCKQETNYPIPSFSGHVMQPRINQVSDPMPPNCPMQTAPTVGGSVPTLQENHFPNQTGLPFPMQVNNVMPQQTQPLDLCSSNSMYPPPMYSVTGYPYPQNYMCGQTLAPLVAPSSSKDQRLISPESKTFAPEGQSSQTSSEKQTLSSFPLVNSQPRPMAGPAPQLPLTLSSFTKLSTPQVCEDDDYDT